MVNDGIVKKAGYGKFELVDGAKFDTTDTTSPNQAWNKELPSSCTGTTQSTTAKLGTSDTTNCKPNNDKGFNEVVSDEVVPLVPVKTERYNSKYNSKNSLEPNNDNGLPKVNDEVVSLVPGFTPPPSKPLNGEFVPLHKFLTIKRHRDLGLDDFFQNKAMIRGTVHDHYYVKFVAAFKNEYNRNAGRVIRKITDEMRKGYPFSDVMAGIISAMDKAPHCEWVKIKASLLDEHGDDELDFALKELIEAGFVEYNAQKETLKFVD